MKVSRWPLPVAPLLMVAPLADAETRVGISDIRTTMTGKTCRKGYVSSATNAIPPDDSAIDNAPALSLRLKKSCAGAVIAHVTSETAGRIAVVARATCTATGRFSNACSVGQVKYSHDGQGGYDLDDNIDTAPQSHAGTFVFTGLKRGKWRIDFLPSNSGLSGSSMGYRAMTVTAFSGG